MPLAVGTKLGPYEILAPIGAGGMGEVYRARDTKLDRDLAVKVLPESVAENPERLARFEREAKVLAALNHPNVAQIYGVEGQALIMELVEGETLSGPLALDTALDYARQIADALEAAHDKGIVHRDLKPSNLIVTSAGTVKVLDFGLAKSMDATAPGDPANSSTLTMSPTHSGMILGTAAYMSPEQVRGKAVDKRADIWAFGVVFYEMLSGRRLFDGETVSDILAGVLRAEIEWANLPPATPPKVRRLLQRCLERDPNRRLRDIGDAWMEFDTPDEPAALPPRAQPARTTRWLPWIAAAVISAASLGWAVLRTLPEPPRPVVRWSYTQQNAFGTLALSRDGARLAFTEFTGVGLRIMLRNLDQLEARPVPGVDNGVGPVFSPDGQWIAYMEGHLGDSAFKLQKVPVAGGSSVSLHDSVVNAGINWGDDGTIVFVTAKGLARVASAGGAPEVLTTVDSNKGETAHTQPYFLPGANAILFGIRAGGTPQVAVLDLKQRSYRVLVNNGTRPRYAPTGHLLFARDQTVFAIPFDARRLRITGSEVPVIEGSAALLSGGIADYAVSDSGLLAYMVGASQGGRKTVLNWVNRRGVVQRLSDLQVWGTGRLSPDGRRVANSLIGANGLGDIWIYEIERRTLTRLTFDGQDQHPIWTPDGRRITYANRQSGKNGLYWVRADGSGKPELLLAGDAVVEPYSWSPDGSLLVYSQRGSDKNLHLWALPVSAAGPAGKPSLLHDSPFSESDAQISPNGRWIAYVSSESGSDEVYAQPFPSAGPKVRLSAQGGFAPRWSRTGRELFFWGAGRSLMAVDTQSAANFKAGIPHELFKLFPGSTWDAAPDGERFLIEQAPGINQEAQMNVVLNWFDELRRRVSANR